MKRRCVMCATEFEAKRPQARYCGDRCRQRARRAGVSSATSEPAPAATGDGKSGSAARAWLNDKAIDPERKPAAADLLVVADAIDAATAAKQIQYVAALARQAAALRAELAPRHDDPEGGSGDPPPNPAPEPAGAKPGSFDASSL